MSLRRLRYVVAVADEGTFTAAARALHMAQPPLSTQVRALERELGAELFDRSSRNPTLTAAGRVVLVEARRILARYDELADLARAAQAGSTGRLAIGFVPSAATGPLPAVLRHLRSTTPDLELSLVEGRPLELLQRLDGDDLDVVLTYAEPTDPRYLNRVLTHEELLLALPLGHPLARGGSVRVAALAGEPVVLPARHGDDGLHQRTTSLLAGVDVRIVQGDVWMVQTMLGLVAAGIGCAVVPASTAGTYPGSVEYRPLTGAQPGLELVATWRADRGAATVTRLLTAWADAS